MYFQPEENLETRIAKNEKVLKNMSRKILFFLIFYAKQGRLKSYGKTKGKAVIPGNFKRGCKRSPYDSGVLLY